MNAISQIFLLIGLLTPLSYAYQCHYHERSMQPNSDSKKNSIIRHHKASKKLMYTITSDDVDITITDTGYKMIIPEDKTNIVGFSLKPKHKIKIISTDDLIKYWDNRHNNKKTHITASFNGYQANMKLNHIEKKEKAIHVSTTRINDDHSWDSNTLKQKGKLFMIIGKNR